MNKWKQMVLGDMGYTYGGLTNKTIVDFGFGKPFIPYMNIFSNGKINPKFLVLVNINPGERQNTVKYGDLFFTTSSETVEEVGMTSVLLDDIGEAYLNSFCFGFRLNNFDDLLPEFAPYLFRSIEIRKKISLFGQGSTRYNLPKTELLGKLKIELPSIPEQQKIAQILSATDSVIEKTQTAIAKYKAIKQGMLNDLFTRGIDIKTGKLRPKQKDAPEMYKESELVGWIPNEWSEERLEDLVEIDSEQLTTSTDANFSFYYIDISSVSTGTILYSPSRIQFKNSPSRARKVVRFNDVLLATVRPNLKAFAHFKRQCAYPHIASTGFAVLHEKKNTDIDFVYQILFSEYIEKQIEAVVVGSNYPAINSSDVRNLKVMTPTYSEQKTISNKILSIDQKIHAEQTYLQKLQQIKSGLMADLLSGNKLVSIPKEMETQTT
jgi:type I restriction enzyme S subunit